MFKKFTVAFLTASALLSTTAFASTTSTWVTPQRSQQSNSPIQLKDMKPGTVYSSQQLGIIYHIPPAGFDPLTASPSALRLYGIPKRPTDPTKLKAWTDAMTHAKSFVVPKFTRGKKNVDYSTPSLTTTARVTSSGSATSQNWSGVINTTSSDYYSDVQGVWNEPNYTTNWANTPSSGDGTERNAYVSMWVGLGGDNSKKLIQIGTQGHLTVIDNGTTYSTSDKAWFEVLPKDPYEVNISNFPVHIGDQIYADASYGSGNADFFFEDMTTGQTTSFTDTGDSSDYDGSTAEWVVERPQITRTDGSSYLAILPDFGSVQFTSCVSDDSSGMYPDEPLNFWPYETLNMVSNTTGDTLATVPSLNSSESFTDYWKLWE